MEEEEENQQEEEVYDDPNEDCDMVRPPGVRFIATVEGPRRFATQSHSKLLYYRTARRYQSCIVGRGRDQRHSQLYPCREL